MWVTQGLLIIVGVSSGAVIASGLFSFVTSLGLVSKFAGRTRTGDYIHKYETAISLGGIMGSILFIFQFPIPFAYVLMPVLGLSAGVFVGGWAVSIAEVTNIFPVLIRRVKLLKHIPYLVVSIALGKGVGMLLMFLYG